MKALQSFTVRPQIPEALAPLETLAHNLRWSWDRRTRALFEWVDPTGWDNSAHDPVRLLGEVGRERLDELARDERFMRSMHEATADLDTYMTEDRWFQQTGNSALRSVAYFSPEFGITEALPQYSGGLGILAGDHLKAASDLGVPLVGVGLFYRHGYFRQSLSMDGWQQERFPSLDPYAMALTHCGSTRVQVDLGGSPLTAQIWKAEVGRVRLYLLDADIDENSNELRQVTDRLYGGDVEHRLRQEILLGIGGVRALRAVGEDVQVFHTNEGHAGFLGLERIRQYVTEQGMSFSEALEAARSGCLFTTHTPVPAGIDRFPREMIEKYFWSWAHECGVDIDDLMALGHRPEDGPEERFNMAFMGLRLAAKSNGVSKLHGEVSRDMFHDLWPDVPTNEVPITSVTNGVHGTTWTSPEIDEMLRRIVGTTWSSESDAWSKMDSARPDEIWSTRQIGTERLITFVREHLRSSGLEQGLSSSDLAWTGQAFDPNALTICFARRFATYKRAALLLSQPERLERLLLDNERPIQFIFAGKAHPADDLGKDLIRQIVEFSNRPGIRERFAFIPDYDMAVARALYSGADVWLNNPRRPMEACGTSGEKAALNGALNCSILDGWWDEMFNGENGWAISTAEGTEDLDRRDELEANSLFDLLETQIVPQFWDRSGGSLPLTWIDRMKTNWTSLGPQVTAQRMVRDYVTNLYEPIASRADELTANNASRASELASWKARVIRSWPQVRIEHVGPELTTTEIGASHEIEAYVQLGDLAADDVEVQLLHGPVGQHGEIEHVTTLTLSPDADTSGTSRRYAGSFVCSAAGRYGFTARIVPAHRDLSNYTELGLLAWA